MTLPLLPPCYCTNVHPGRSVVEIVRTLDEFAVPVRDRFAATEHGGPLAVGLWFADPVVRELRADPDGPARLADELRRRELDCYTLNAFPFGDFHRDAVKAAVYRPTWADPARRDYTLACAAALAALLPEGREGSVSTLPLGSRLNGELPADFEDRCVAHLLDVACGLDELHDATGRAVRLAIEPEPFCEIETTAGAVAFFDRLRARADAAGCGAAAREHLGVCFDVCHQAVEFEDVAASVAAFESAGVRVNKVQLSCAVETPSPRGDAARTALLRYAEPRYLHQTFAARKRDGGWEVVARAADLTRDAVASLPTDEDPFTVWRTHFHVPVSRSDLGGGLRTTRADLEAALAAVAALPYAPHLEVETYTWPVLPGEEHTREHIVEGIAAELAAVAGLTAAPRGPAA